MIKPTVEDMILDTLEKQNKILRNLMDRVKKLEEDNLTASLHKTRQEANDSWLSKAEACFREIK